MKRFTVITAMIHLFVHSLSGLTLFAFSLFGSLAFAVPQMDSSVGFSSPLALTVVRDSVDKDLFYIFPQRFGLAKRSGGRYKFYVQNYNNGLFDKKAFVSMTFAPYFDKGLLARAVREIKATNRLARFSLVPIRSSQLSTPKIMFPGFDDVSCESTGGLLGQDISCHITLNRKGISLFLKRLQTDLTHVFHVNYKFLGALGSQNTELAHSIPMYAGKISGPYFFDENGSLIATPEIESEADLGESFEDVLTELRVIEKESERHEPAQIPTGAILEELADAIRKITGTLVDLAPIIQR